MTGPSYLNLEVVLSKTVNDLIQVMTDSNSVIEKTTGLKTADIDAFENNLKNGFAALVMMCTYLETAVNSTIREIYKGRSELADFTELNKHLSPEDFKLKLRERAESRGGDPTFAPVEMFTLSKEEIFNRLRMPLKEKTKGLFDEGRLSKDPRQTKLWDRCMEVINLRDNLIHFKANCMQDTWSIDFDCWVVPGAFEVDDLATRFTVNRASLGVWFTKSRMNQAWRDISDLVMEFADSAGCMMKPGSMLIETGAKDGFASYIVNSDDYRNVYPDYNSQ